MTTRNMGDEVSQPNILILCTDQQRFDALGAYGNAYIRTPTIDQLAAEGVLFENCYVQSPVCAPSRATMLTGRYVHAHRLRANGVALPPDELLFTKVLAQADYDCGLAGKMHLKACQSDWPELPPDGVRVFRWAHDPYHHRSENQYHRWLQARFPDLYDAAVRSKSQLAFDTLPAEAHYSHWMANETIDFLCSSRQRDKPFCFIANFFDPHHPFGAPKEYLDRYDPGVLPRPITLDGELDGKPPTLAEASRRSYAGHAKGYVEYTEQELQDARAAYYAMVTLIDDEVARILTALEDEGLAANTMVIFTSDHGEMLGDHQLMLKGPMMYECAVRVPLIIRWPGRFPAGSRREQLVQWVDLAPTILDAAGLPPLPHGHGMSLLPLARGNGDAPTREWALCEYRDSGSPYDPPVHTTMLRHEKWKIVVWHGRPGTERERTGELYDLESDPHEFDNLWEDPAYRDIRLRLQELLLDVLVATEDHCQPRAGNF